MTHGRSAALPVVLAALLALLVLLGAAAYWSAQGTEVTPQDPVVPAPAPFIAGGAAATAPGERAAATRVALGAGDAESAPASRPARLPTRLTGQVQRRDGTPVAGAEVALVLRDADNFWCIDLEYAKESATLATTRCAGDGSFGFDVQRGRRHRVRASAPPLAPRTVVDACGGMHVTIVLDEGAVLEGRVTEQDTGAPIPNVPIRVFPVGVSLELGRTTTQLDGTYRLTGLSPAEAYVEALPPGYAMPGWGNVRLVSGAMLRCDFRVERGARVHGRVTDRVNGAPIADAEVGDAWTFKRSTRTDGEGRYVLEGMGTSHGHEVHVRARGYAAAVQPMSARDAEGRLDFVLQRGAAVRGRVLDNHGRPMGGVYVAAACEWLVTPGMMHTDWLPARTEADGRFLVRGLGPDRIYLLYLRAPRHGVRSYDLPRPLQGGETFEAGDLVLAPEGGIEGVVVDREGKPMPGAQVDIRGRNQDFRKLAEGAAGARGRREASQATSMHIRCDLEGRFRFPALAGGGYTISARETRTQAEARPENVQIVDGEWRDDLRIQIDLGLTIEGRVRTATGESPVGARMWLTAAGPGKPTASARVAEDGTFVFAQLTPGAYSIQAQRLPEDWTLAPIADVAGGTKDLDVVLVPGAWIEGRVDGPDGKPVRDAMVTWAAGGVQSGLMSTHQTGPEGKFRIKVPPDTPVDITARRTGANFVPLTTHGTTVRNVAPGTRDVVIRLP